MMETAPDVAGRPALFKGPARYVANTPWGPGGAIFAAFVVFIGQIAGVAIAVLALESGAGPEGEAVTPDNIVSLASPVGLTIMIASQIASVILVWLFAGRKGMRKEVLKLGGERPAWTTYLAGGLLVIVMTGLVEAALYGVVGFDYKADTKDMAEGILSSYWPGVIVVAVVLAPLWEELTFRGFLLPALAQTRLGFWGAALLSNAAWASLHFNYSIAGLVSVFTAGLVLSWLLWRTGSIRVPIAAHAIANIVAVVFAYMVHGAS
jgi:membrane protease YdiL (CAAX protease family)